MRLRFDTPLLLHAALALLSLPSLASAAVITTNYGNLTGSTVKYQAVTETSSSGNPFGTPTYVADDTIKFSPTTFEASPLSPSLSQIVDSQIRFTMMALAGQSIPELSIKEVGAVTLTGDNTSDDYASAGVGMAIFYHIRAINGVSINGPQGSLNMTFTPSNGVFNLADGVLNNAQWTGYVNLDFNAIIAQSAFAGTGSATTVEITFDNTLSAANFNGGFASIEKQFVEISVPEPSSVLLLLSGSGLLASFGLGRHFRRS